MVRQVWNAYDYMFCALGPYLDVAFLAYQIPKGFYFYTLGCV